MRWVIDTDVMVAALRSGRSASRQLLLYTLDNRIPVLASVPLMFEYEAVMTRSEHLHAASLGVEEVGVIIDALAKVVIPVHLRFLWRPRLKDPADEMVLETAVNGSANRLVTFNVRHFADAARVFGIQVIRPGEAWKEIEQGNEKE